MASFVFRLVNMYLVQTWFVPDEYWQSLEPAHRLVYGNGFLTWEYRESAIRSYIYPMLLSIGYRVGAALSRLMSSVFPFDVCPMQASITSTPSTCCCPG